MIPARQLPWVVSIRGMVAIACIATACVWLGLSFAKPYVLPPQPTYRPDFGKAHWIAPDGPEGRAYYRKELYVTGPVRRAWVMATAPDSLAIYVNSQQVSGNNPTAAANASTAEALTACPTALVDITPYLKVGTNTLAISVSSQNFNTPGSLLLRGAIEYEMDRQDFISDESWRASTYPNVLDNLMSWTDPALDDFHWPLAKITTFPYPSCIRPVVVPPALFEGVIKAQWMSAFPEVSRSAVFTRSFQLPSGIKDGWLQVASVGQNLVTVNGRTIAGSVESDRDNMGGPVSPLASAQLHYYYIKPWLRSGSNRISIRVDSFSENPALMAQISYQNPAGNYVVLAPNQDWQVQNVEGNEKREVVYSPTVTIAGAIISNPVQLVGASAYLNSVYSTLELKTLFWGLLIGAVFFLIHLLIAQCLFQRNGRDRSRAVALDALFHVPVILALLFLQLLRYDAHFQPEWAQQPGWFWLILILWIALRVWAVIEFNRPRQIVQEDRWWSTWVQGRGFLLALSFITVFSFGLRVSGINLFSLNNDEITIVQEVKGVWARGYPSKDYRNDVVRASSYELLSYPIAASTLLFGWSDWAVRIPALLFGTFTTWNIGRMGRDMFSSRVGLIASLLHAIIPINVYWARNCFHPADDQFFGVLCLWSFYRAIREPGELNPWQFTLTCLYFLGLYFSWEGSVFVLPAFVIAIMVLNPRRWGWLRQWPLYLGLAVVCSCVLIQLGTRSIKIPYFLTIGLGLANQGPGLIFLDPTGYTNYYTSGVMIYPCHILLTLLFLLGFFYIGRSRALRYVLVMFFALLFFYSNFLPIYSNRYFFFYQCLLLVGASASLVYLSDTLQQLARREWGRAGRLTARWSSYASLVLIIVMATGGGLGLTIVNALPEDSTAYYGAYSVDYRKACRYISDNFRPGDLVMGNQYYVYFGNKSPDVNQNIVENSRSIFDPTLGPFGTFEQINYRVPSLLTERDLVDCFSKAQRIWFIVDQPPLIGPDVIQVANERYITHRSRLVYSTFLINIYLCEGMATKANEAIPDLGLPPTAALLFGQHNSPNYIQDSLHGILTRTPDVIQPSNLP